jgi:hypothetical protein
MIIEFQTISKEAMQIQFQTISNEAARHAASSLDSAVRRILNTALGHGNWTLSDVPIHGELRQYGNSLEVLWDGRKLATIHRHQRWEETVFAPGCRWTMTLSVCQHVEHVEAG